MVRANCAFFVSYMSLESERLLQLPHHITRRQTTSSCATSEAGWFSQRQSLQKTLSSKDETGFVVFSTTVSLALLVAIMQANG